jgi:hypothetical protein
MPRFVRVKDPQTKHQFDVPEGDPRIGKTLEALDDKRWPVSDVVRPPLHHIKLAGRTASRETATSIEAPEATTTEEK